MVVSKREDCNVFHMVICRSCNEAGCIWRAPQPSLVDRVVFQDERVPSAKSSTWGANRTNGRRTERRLNGPGQGCHILQRCRTPAQARGLLRRPLCHLLTTA